MTTGHPARTTTAAPARLLSLLGQMKPSLLNLFMKWLTRERGRAQFHFRAKPAMSPFGTEQTCRDVRVESAYGGKPDLTIATADFRV
jgi:hypothetical protein